MPSKNWTVATSCVAAVLIACSGQLGAATAAPQAAEVEAAMKKAAAFYRSQVASHGGYVYFYSADLQHRYGEGEASPDQIWVQPPGTPTVGMAYLAAYEATGDPFYLKAATETAEALLYGQLKSGAWANVIDFDPQGSRVSLYRNGMGRGRNTSSLDDGQSQAAIRFLIQADRAHNFKHREIHEGVTAALDALLAAQFDNGAFPQGWDDPVPTDQPVIPASYPDYDWRNEGRVKNYWDMYTLNDGLAGTVAAALVEAHQTYGDERYEAALKRLGDFLLLAQMPQPQPGWAQQYSYQMHPIWARKFEPAAIAGRESQDVLKTLLNLYAYTGDPKYLAPIPAAVDYLRRSQLPDGRLARYYELRTNRPLYMERRGDLYKLTYDDARLPDHYGWKSESELDEIVARYESLQSEKAAANETTPSTEVVSSILESLDAEGRWINEYQGELLVGDQKFRPGDRYISSEVFSTNLKILSLYLQSLQTEPQGPDRG